MSIEFIHTVAENQHIQAANIPGETLRLDHLVRLLKIAARQVGFDDAAFGTFELAFDGTAYYMTMRIHFTIDDDTQKEAATLLFEKFEKMITI